MKEEVKQQHLQIIEMIKKKYPGKTSYKICEHFVLARVDDLPEETGREVLQKFISMFGRKEAYSDEDMLMLILVCIVAQRGLPFKDVDPKSFFKYKSKSLKIKQSKPKEESSAAVNEPKLESTEANQSQSLPIQPSFEPSKKA